mgnify:CR=1 FL=1
MKLFVLLGALFFLPGLVFGQTMVKGYIINEKGDTLKGEIKINTKKECSDFEGTNYIAKS